MCLKLTARVYGLSDNVSNNKGSEKCATPWEKTLLQGTYSVEEDFVRENYKS
jgi:hypothetical protein